MTLLSYKRPEPISIGVLAVPLAGFAAFLWDGILIGATVYSPDALFDVGRFRHFLFDLLPLFRNDGKSCIVDGISDISVASW